MRPDSRAPLSDVVTRALLACGVLGAARALLFALEVELFDVPSARLAARMGASELAGAMLASALPLFALAWLARRAPRAPRTLGALGALGAAALGYLFVSFRLPADPFLAPGFSGARALGAHAAALAAGLAAAGAIARRRCPGRRLGAAASALLLAAALLFSAASRGTPGARPSVLLISLDTVRADRLGCYGHARPTTPSLDRFARDSVRFERAFSPESWTLSAHASLLTGLYPAAHGVDETHALSPGVRTLAEALRGAGHATLAVVDRVVWLHPRYGFARGFLAYWRTPDDARVKVDAALRWLDAVGEAPFFLFVHFFDAHSDTRELPYEAEPRDLELMAGWYRGPFRGCEAELGCATRYLEGLRERGQVPASERLELLASWYDAGLRSLDREVGRLLSGLEARGRLGDTVVVVTADHGEELFEHGEPLHRQSYEECMAVPLLVRAPGVAPATCGVPVSLVDLAPTVLELCGAPAVRAQGRSLVPLLTGGVLEPAREIVLVEDEGGTLGLRSDAFAVVPADGERWLFDMLADPGQRSPAALEAGRWTELLDAEAESARALRAELGAPLDLEPPARGERVELGELGYGGEAPRD